MPLQHEFTLSDGTEVQVQEASPGCYSFMLFPIEGQEDNFTWDLDEARDVMDSSNLTVVERRRNEVLRELWRVI